MRKAEEYQYKVFWSEEDSAYIGVVAEFQSLSHIDDTPLNALAGIIDVVDFVLGDLAENGESIPEPLSKREYTGKFALRMTPQQHRRLAQEAAEQHVSMNQLLVSRI